MVDNKSEVSMRLASTNATTHIGEPIPEHPMLESATDNYQSLSVRNDNAPASKS